MKKLAMWFVLVIMMVSLLQAVSAYTLPTLTEYGSNPIYGGPTSGTTRAYNPTVIKIGSTYHMWYGDGANLRYINSTSPVFSGATFPGTIVTGLAGQPYKARIFYDPAGWTLGGIHHTERFVVYYSNAADWNAAPKIAVSNDGLSWTYVTATTGINTYPSAGAFYQITVLKESDTNWRAYGDQGQAIIQAYTSTNGVNWTGVATDILCKQNVTCQTMQSWESRQWGAIAPHVEKIGSEYVLFYSSGLTGNDQAIGYAYSTDGVTFTKGSTNPVFSKDDGVAWRNVRTYAPYLLIDGSTMRLYIQGRDSATSSYSIGTTSYTSCTPDWSCNGYAACDINDEEVCDSVTDLNTCGSSYTGDYSEFTPQVCDYCTPDWSCDGYSTTCVSGKFPCNSVTDGNTCSEAYTGDYSEFIGTTCPSSSGGSNTHYVVNTQGQVVGVQTKAGVTMFNEGEETKAPILAVADLVTPTPDSTGAGVQVKTFFMNLWAKFAALFK